MKYIGVDAVAPQHAYGARPGALAVSVNASGVVAPQLPVRALGPGYFWMKRIFDLVLALLLVMLLLPLLIVVAILVCVTSPGPAIFAQERVGRGGHRFTMYKFRSMRVDADPRVHEEAVERYIRGEALSISNPNLRYKLAADPRVTPVGAFLRKTSIDELPQLFNVIRGDMSLVGPRPALPYETSRYPETALLRLSVPQGITGLWQVRGRSRVTWDEALALDVEYAQRCSFFLDCKILLLTIRTVLLTVGGA